jgi:hypothetical protein
MSKQQGRAETLVKTSLFPLPRGGFGLWNWASSVVRQREEKALQLSLFYFCALRNRFFALFFLRAPAQILLCVPECERANKRGSPPLQMNAYNIYTWVDY